MRMADLLEECITDLSAPGGSKDYPAFQATFCARCRNPGCAHAKWATDKFGARVQTQVDRFFGSPQADPNDPKYAQLKDFQDCMREAIRLEAADKAGDWEVPEVDISDGQTETARADTTSHVDAAVRTLARVKGRDTEGQGDTGGFNERGKGGGEEPDREEQRPDRKQAGE